MYTYLGMDGMNETLTLEKSLYTKHGISFFAENDPETGQR